jgi:hypothetical protein
VRRALVKIDRADASVIVIYAVLFVAIVGLLYVAFSIAGTLTG